MARRRGRAWGAGSEPYKRPDGRWATQVWVTESGTGRRVRRTLYARTKAELEDKREELLLAEANNEPIPASTLTLATYLPEWLEHLAKPRIRPTTYKAYKGNIDKYLVPDLGRRPLGQLSARELRMYFDGLRRQGAGARTVQYLHATLRAALEDAVREELIAKNVAKLVRIPRPESAERQPLSVNEVRTLLRAHTDDDLLPMLTVFALLGMRRSEVLGLKWSDVDLEAGTLRISRSVQRVEGKLVELPTKTDRSRRTIPLPGSVVTVLKDHRDRQAKARADATVPYTDLGFVFATSLGTPIDPRNCTRLVQKACERAGVRKVRLHDFRHGCVSVLLELEVPPRTVMEIVGHATLEMTMNLYGHVSLDSKRTAMERLDTLFVDPEERK